jgi:hypothetical protein
MFLPTKPFSDKIKDYDEPTLRIGRKVPKNAVNLAYYFNPTATDAEKVLCVDAPRNTIDHRVEVKYLYKYDLPDKDNSLFDKFFFYEDEEGYSGYLPLVNIDWYEKKHVATKYVVQEKTYVTDEKNDVDTHIYYMEKEDGTSVEDPDPTLDTNGIYAGYIFLSNENVHYEVKEVKTEIINTSDYINVKNVELQPYVVDSDYTTNLVQNSEINKFMTAATQSNSPWPEKIWVGINGIYNNASCTGKPLIAGNLFNGYISESDKPLVWQYNEKEPVSWEESGIEAGSVEYAEELGRIFLSYKTTDKKTATELKQSGGPFPTAGTTWDTDNELEEFWNIITDTTYGRYNTDDTHSLISGPGDGVLNDSQTKLIEILNKWKNGEEKAENIKIICEESNSDYGTNTSGDIINAGFVASFKMVYIHRANEKDGSYSWSVYANYAGTLVKTMQELKQTPTLWEAKLVYEGQVRKVWNTYDATAMYRGSITQGEGAGNVNPELSPDILLYPDDNGYLRRQIKSTKNDANGNIISVKSNIYEIEAEHFYISNVFKNGTACFYKYDLKHPIHDYRGPDINGFYSGDAVKVYTSNMKDISSDSVYQLKLTPAETKTESFVLDNEVKERTIATKYYASIYTSFISKTTNTFKASYNAFVDFNTDDIINTNNGIDEEIYNKPFMFKNIDYTVESVDKYERSSKIKILKPNIIEDTRAWINFEYTITAYKKIIGGAGVEKIFTTSPRTAKILNKEYAVESEYNKFEGRAMIISPLVNGIYKTPFDLVIDDQGIEPVVTVKNADEFIFKCELVTENLNPLYFGAINLKCNADGTGYITAETTLDTGFFNENTQTYTDKLIINNPYLIENGKIYPGYMVKCLDVRQIAVRPPRENNLLDSWYPLIRFGHYSKVMDQYGASIKVCYTMPEYDDQDWGKYGIPYIDIKNEKVEILNTHMIKVNKYPLFFKDKDDVKIYRWKDDEVFELTVDNVSFSEGIILVKEALSENDKITVDYTYLEEHYQYRGYQRNESDWCRIDLNPNKYHTYSDLQYTPSELKPTTNLFNKTLYFYLRPTIKFQGKQIEDTSIDTETEVVSDFLKDLWEASNIIQYLRTGEQTVLDETQKQKIWKYDETLNSIKSKTNDEIFYTFLTDKIYTEYTHSVTINADAEDNDTIAIVIAAVKNEDGTYETLTLTTTMNTEQFWNNFGSEKCPQLNLVYNYYQSDYEDVNASKQIILATDATFTPGEILWNVTGGMRYKIHKTKKSIKIYRTELGQTADEQISENPVIDISLEDIRNITGVDFTIGVIGYGNVSQAGVYFSDVKIESTNQSSLTTYFEWDTENPILKNDLCLYHTIDEYWPESSEDIYIGSVYIRQNTSLYSTILIDTRTRGGGVLEEIKDSLRRQLEPESDFYLDIGCYDGTPYQENAVIIVRLDNSILEEYGGRFKQGDIEQKVKKFLGLGVYPIIEYVDSYSKYDLPQYNLKTTEEYTNMLDQTLEFSLECVTV